MLIPLAPPIPWIAMTFLIATQIVGDGALTVYLINETTLRQRLLPPEALGRAAGTWQVANGVLTPVGALIGAVLAEGHRDAADAVAAPDRFRASRSSRSCALAARFRRAMDRASFLTGRRQRCSVAGPYAATSTRAPRRRREWAASRPRACEKENVARNRQCGLVQKRLTEALEQQAATGEILRVISRSRTDVAAGVRHDRGGGAEAVRRPAPRTSSRSTAP